MKLFSRLADNTQISQNSVDRCRNNKTVNINNKNYTRQIQLAVKVLGRDPFNQHSDRSDREKRTTSKGGPVFSKLFRLDRTDPLSFGPKFPEILVEWIAPLVSKDGEDWA